MENIKSFDEFIIDEGKIGDFIKSTAKNITKDNIKDFAKATALATTLGVTAHLSDKPTNTNQDNVNKEKIEYVEKQTDVEDEKVDFMMRHPGDDYYPSDVILIKVKDFEKWHEGWKNDGKGNPTTGWGFKSTPELRKRFPKGMTREQADKYFEEELIPRMVEEFKKSVPNIDKYTQGQLDALFDLFYNIGMTKFTQESPNLQNGLKSCNVKQIVKEMDHDYNDPSVPGARKRRDFERQMFVEYA